MKDSCRRGVSVYTKIGNYPTRGLDVSVLCVLLYILLAIASCPEKNRTGDAQFPAALFGG